MIYRPDLENLTPELFEELVKLAEHGAPESAPKTPTPTPLPEVAGYPRDLVEYRRLIKGMPKLKINPELVSVSDVSDPIMLAGGLNGLRGLGALGYLSPEYLQLLRKKVVILTNPKH